MKSCKNKMTHKSISYDQFEILDAIIDLHTGDIECDVTYGNGSFYKGRNEPKFKLDIQPLYPDVVRSCSTSTPFEDGQLSNIMFDPPFLTYIKQGREHGSIMSKRFGGYWAYSELEAHYRGTIKEAARTLKSKGQLVIKCQDIIHNHKMFCTHANVISWAAEHGFRVKDLFILNAKNRMPVNKGSKQQHARIHHSYFLVLEGKKK